MSARTGLAGPVDADTTLVWAQAPSGLYHLARSDRYYTLCGRRYTAGAAPWPVRHSTELPADAGRLPCMQCNRARRRQWP